MDQRTPRDELAVADALERATAEELCKALLDFSFDDDQLCDKLNIDLSGQIEDARQDGIEEGRAAAEGEVLDALDTDSLCDAIAEGRTRDALDILHEAGLGSGLHPSTQMHLVELRRTA